MTLPLAKQGMKTVVYDIMDRMAEHYPDLVENWLEKRVDIEDIDYEDYTLVLK